MNGSLRAAADGRRSHSHASAPSVSRATRNAAARTRPSPSGREPRHPSPNESLCATNQSPFTFTTCRSVCRTRTSDAASAITRSIGLYAAGISSMNASVSRNSMPAIASRS